MVRKPHPKDPNAVEVQNLRGQTMGFIAAKETHAYRTPPPGLYLCMCR